MRRWAQLQLQGGHEVEARASLQRYFELDPSQRRQDREALLVLQGLEQKRVRSSDESEIQR